VEIFQNSLQELAESLGVSQGSLQLLLLLSAGIVLHIALRLTLGRLHHLARVSNHPWDDVFVTALEAPLRVVLWVGVAYLCLDVLSKTLQQQVTTLLDTSLILVLTWFAQRMIKGVEDQLLAERGDGLASTDRATVQAVAKLLRIILWVFAGLTVLQTLGISISGLLAFGGIGGIAVGFAAKDLLANFFGSLSIYLDRPFTTGDWIRSPDKEIEGTVEEIGWRLTCIRTFDQRPLYVPNALFSQISVENPSRMRNRRIYETIGLRYEDAGKVDAVVSDVREMLRAHPEIDLTRTLIVNFVSFGPSSLDFFVYTFTKTTDWVRFHEIKQDVLLQILDIIYRHGADVAFPTQTLHVEQIEPEVAS
jgi:MscS family membrane protein